MRSQREREIRRKETVGLEISEADEEGTRRRHDWFVVLGETCLTGADPMAAVAADKR